jgi:hypothetical protein
MRRCVRRVYSHVPSEVEDGRLNLDLPDPTYRTGVCTVPTMQGGRRSHSAPRRGERATRVRYLACVFYSLSSVYGTCSLAQFLQTVVFESPLYIFYVLPLSISDVSAVDSRL